LLVYQPLDEVFQSFSPPAMVQWDAFEWNLGIVLVSSNQCTLVGLFLFKPQQELFSALLSLLRVMVARNPDMQVLINHISHQPEYKLQKYAELLFQSLENKFRFVYCVTVSQFSRDLSEGKHNDMFIDPR
jgi:hypothetical protein